MAWYPIYRVPEGNFRSAFLTFHSLGHLMHRSARIDSQSVQNCIVCPVVGLQSYNAQVIIALLFLYAKETCPAEMNIFHLVEFIWGLMQYVKFPSL